MARQHRFSLTTLSLLALIGACGDDGTTLLPAVDAGDVTDTRDTAPDEDVPPPLPACLEVVVTDTPFAIDAAGPATQIHAAAAFDGREIWVVYNRPVDDDSGGFDVWMTRLSCDGTASLEPRRINAIGGRILTEPEVAVGHERLLVVWQSDNGTGADNLDIMARAFSLDGEPLADAESPLEMTRGGVAQTGNAWMPALAATDDGFFVAGSWGHDDAPAFQVFVQNLTPDGEPIGDAADVALGPQVGQVFPDLTVGDGMSAVVSWTETAVGATDVPRIARLGGDAPFDEQGLGDLEGGGTGVVARGDTTFAALTGDSETIGDVIIHRVGPSGPVGAGTRIGMARRIDHTPSLALDPVENTGLVMWYRVISGFRNDVVVQPFFWEGADDEVAMAPGAELTPVDPAAPYGTVVVALGDRHYFVAWSEGVSPDLRVTGRIVAF